MEEVMATIVGAVHILAVATWIGGVIYLYQVMLPAREKLDPPQRGVLMAAAGPRWTVIVWTSAIIMILTGIIKAVGLGVLNPDTLFNTLYGNILAVKIVLVAAVVLLGVMTTKASIDVGKLGEAGAPLEDIAKGEEQITYWSAPNFVFGVIIIFLAVGMRVVGIE